VNRNDRSPVTQLHVTACIFRSSYAFHLTAKGPSVCPLSGGFCTTYCLPLQGFEVTYAILEISMT